MKWSGKTEQRAKTYPTMTTGYRNDEKTQFSDKFNATVALEALGGDKTAQEIAAKHKIHPTQVTTWKRQAIDGLTRVFSDKDRKAEPDQAVQVAEDQPLIPVLHTGWHKC